VRGPSRIDVVPGVPEQSVVIGRLVSIGVVDIDVGHVTGQVVHQSPPAHVARPHELPGESGDSVVLIVVVRDTDRVRVERRFVVREQVAEVAPSVVVDALAAGHEPVERINRNIDERLVFGAGATFPREHVRDSASIAVPGWWQAGVQGRTAPFER
jgi:hypothetical protein